VRYIHNQKVHHQECSLDDALESTTQEREGEIIEQAAEGQP
jgi:hypothetical protein